MDQIKNNRLLNIDFLRGLIILLMVVDHTRDMFHNYSIPPTMSLEISWGLFLTRWITHFCAPLFVFLAGLAIYLKSKNPKLTKKELQLFLIKRGVFLILLEFVVVSALFHVILNAETYVFRAQVIWAIGISMLFLALLLYLPKPLILLVCLLLICTNNLFDGYSDPGCVLWNFLHIKTSMPLTSSLMIRSGYPLYPWPGIMGLGYCFGYLFWGSSISSDKRKRWLLSMGAAGLIMFLVLRMTNIYGDPSAFIASASFSVSAKSFLNTTKYPPSLLYLLMTIPVGLLVLGLTEKVQNRVFRFVSYYGRAPLFCYVVHLMMIPLLNKIIALFYHESRFSSECLFVSWVMAALIIAMLFYPAKYYFRFKRQYQHKYSCLRYF